MPFYVVDPLVIVLQGNVELALLFLCLTCSILEHFVLVTNIITCLFRRASVDLNVVSLQNTESS